MFDISDMVRPLWVADVRGYQHEQGRTRQMDRIGLEGRASARPGREESRPSAEVIDRQ
jgi:hypothetical protein